MQELLSDNMIMDNDQTNDKWMVPSSYSRIIARELGLHERQLASLLKGTGLPQSILLPGDSAHVGARQQMRVLENAVNLDGTSEFGLRLGSRLQPASHGPMGYLVLSSPDVSSAIEAFASFLPLRLPFSSVTITKNKTWLICTLGLKVSPVDEVKRILQECFALMLQAVVEAVLGRKLLEAKIEMEHSKPTYHKSYSEYFHVPVKFSQPNSTFSIPMNMAQLSNTSGHSDSYAFAHKLCLSLLEKMPNQALSSSDQVRKLLLSSPPGTLNIDDVAQAMFITKRTLQRRLDREATSYRQITEKLGADLASRHLLESNMTVEAVAKLLGYCDTAAFRKAFHRWYGQSPSQYRTNIQSR